MRTSAFFVLLVLQSSVGEPVHLREEQLAALHVWLLKSQYDLWREREATSSLLWEGLPSPHQRRSKQLIREVKTFDKGNSVDFIPTDCTGEPFERTQRSLFVLRGASESR